MLTANGVWVPTLGVLMVFSPASARSQTTNLRDSTVAAHRLCARERADPRCQTFRVFELGVFAPFTTTVRRVAGTGETNRAFFPHLAWTLGAMHNVGDQSAVGMTGEAGFSTQSLRFAMEARYRHALASRTSIDLALGPLWSHIGDARRSNGVGVTADATLNVGPGFAVIARADRLHNADYGTGGALYGGIALREHAAVVGTGVLGAVAVLAAGLFKIAGPVLR
jgi:hypothetical protein